MGFNSVFKGLNGKKLYREALYRQLRLTLKYVSKRKKISYSYLSTVFCLNSSSSDITSEGMCRLITKGAF
jgi:hypothetical protein